MLGLASLTSAAVAHAAQTATYEIIADDMCCAGCAKKVAAQLYTAPGVMNVNANVATRTVVVTAKPSPKLTVEKLWNAVEKAKGKPSRIDAFGVTYTLTRTADLGAEEQPTAGATMLAGAPLPTTEAVEQFMARLRTVRGVGQVTIDAANGQATIAPAAGVPISPWALAAAVNQSEFAPLVITGPLGRLTITSTADAPQVSSRPVVEGESR